MNVLDLFTPKQKELGVVEIAATLKRPKSSISRLLMAMEKAGFLDRARDSGRYRVSLQLAAIGEMAKHATSLQRAARPALEQLTAVTGETSTLVEIVGDHGVNTESVESPRPVMHMGCVGKRFPLHASAGCKAILAWWRADDVRRLLRAPLEQCTPATITDITHFMQELEGVRNAGYATNWAELEEDLAAVAAPVRDHRGECIASVSISVPIFRIPRSKLPAVAEHVCGAAEMLSRDLGWRGTTRGGQVSRLVESAR